MRKLKLFLVAIFAAFLTMSAAKARGPNSPPRERAAQPNMSSESVQWQSGSITPEAASNGQYVVIAWNDLGMHCISPKFDQMAILPPFNNLMAQVIKRGDPPQIVTSGVTLEYSIVNNTSVAGKTNFWQYANSLFGVNLAPGVGLTGNGLSGKMHQVGDHYEATGIPLLPLDDSMKWNPYQQGLVKLKDASGNLLAQARPIVPVSDELHCDKCHATGGIAAPGIDTGSVDGNILAIHDRRSGTNLLASRPVLCSSCHSDNALGTKGTAGVPSLSQAMHGKHGSLGAYQPGCYDCHPGAKTQCNRSAIEEMGPSGKNPRCESCHGSLTQVADSIAGGRQPWLQEPNCGQCHDSSFSTGQVLYRNSRGHGGVACEACHNSPHAWYPSRKAVDNQQPIALQGSSGALSKCTICHVTSPGGENPHESGSGGGGGGGGGDDAHHGSHSYH